MRGLSLLIVLHFRYLGGKISKPPNTLPIIFQPQLDIIYKESLLKQKYKLILRTLRLLISKSLEKKNLNYYYVFFLFNVQVPKNGRSVLVIRDQKQRITDNPFSCVSGKGW